MNNKKRIRRVNWVSLSNVNADYNLTNLVNVSRVTFDYFDGAGIENLMVNGSFMIDEFGALFGSTFTMGGVDVFITRASAAGYDYGEVILTGNVQSFPPKLVRVSLDPGFTTQLCLWYILLVFVHPCPWSH